MLNDDFATRLSWLRTDNIYQKSTKHGLILKEVNEEGRAEVHFCTDHNELYSFRLEGNNKFPYLTNQKCADGIILELRQEQWFLHVIEFKKTMKKDIWNKTKVQYEGAVLRMHAIMGILGIEKLDGIYFYSAFRNNDFEPKESTSPVLMRQLERRENLSTTVELREWFDEKITVLSLKDMPLQKIRLDKETGRGMVQLSS
ncbi:hypothetical protein [Brevibacillus dissolubilis]|uniref:hypothetical protein n=1 Tax=Brevibacillus dissolubilis TaxID=1844116 RepID=UPI0011176096|nr:hypothetical protein [Brevibacillus dissolubilis]